MVIQAIKETHDHQMTVTTVVSGSVGERKGKDGSYYSNTRVTHS